MLRFCKHLTLGSPGPLGEASYVPTREILLVYIYYNCYDQNKVWCAEMKSCS